MIRMKYAVSLSSGTSPCRSGAMSAKRSWVVIMARPCLRDGHVVSSASYEVLKMLTEKQKEKV
ncbi:MAG: hypothetical protein HDR17_15760 [Lachnospiraceae bacterium]|nr:hypothetical protein [Lachnospiraceae bacterium]